MVAGGKAQAEWMLNYLQDGVLPGPRGMEEMPKVTVLGATTDAGKLPETFLDRFKMCELQPYTPAEAARISAVMSRRIFFPPLPQPSARNHDQVAEASNRNPRVMRHVLEQVPDLVKVQNSLVLRGIEGCKYQLASFNSGSGIKIGSRSTQTEGRAETPRPLELGTAGSSFDVFFEAIRSPTLASSAEAEQVKGCVMVEAAALNIRFGQLVGSRPGPTPFSNVLVSGIVSAPDVHELPINGETDRR